ncbi:MAG: AmmeMemoRadiSam system protein B [Candidatus Binataceae bacterium]|jgi:AmmeMemoRadiSam system protein B
MDKPKIRQVESFPVEQNGQTLICLRDPLGIASQPIVLGMGAYFLVTQFNGATPLAEVQAAYAKRFGESLSPEHLVNLVEALDKAGFLDSPAFAERRRQAFEEFRRNPNRPAAHAGLCYAKEATPLRREIEGFFRNPSGPGQIPEPKNSEAPLSGLIAPHIDPRRGGPAYAHAYGQLMTRERPELVVILGTSHYGGGPQLFTATRKNYATPFGPVATDGEFIERLASRYHEGDLFAEELLHRNEHSIEFQALFLAWALGTAGYKVAPILVGSFHQMIVSGELPTSDARVSGFIAALKAELAVEKRRVLIVAGVDFAHVGKKFGDTYGADAKIAAWLKTEDLALIETIKRGDPVGFFGRIAKERDTRKICGLSPMYTQLELLQGRPGRLLMHDIAMEPQTESAVSFASIAID